jgi:hypothetical protein
MSDKGVKLPTPPGQLKMLGEQIMLAVMIAIYTTLRKPSENVLLTLHIADGRIT